MSHSNLFKSLSNGPLPHPKEITTRFLNGVKRKIGNFSLHTIQKMCERGSNTNQRRNIPEWHPSLAI